MTTIDRIRAEIKKRRLHFNKEAEKYQALNNGYSQNCYGARDALRDLENFLDTLEEPVSDCHDLEEAADDHIRKVVDAAGHPGWDWETQDIADAFKAGAEWMKSKMMEGAVEGTVIELVETYKDLSLSVNAKELNQVLQPLGVGDGNKVKIIIVKEEQQ